MPLQKLQLRPGVNREGTTLANEGGWYDCDKVRFRSGYPEKIGGWAALSYNTFLGVCRSMWNWITLKNYNILGVGTNLKFYVENGGTYYDITPIRETNDNAPLNDITLQITSGSNVLTITDVNADTLQVNDFVTIAGAVDLGTAVTTVTAAVLNQEYQIASVINNTKYTVLLRKENTSIDGVNFTVDTATSVLTVSPTVTVNNGDAVTLLPNIASPAGLNIGITYYIVNAVANTFQLSLTSGGSPISITTTGTGQQAFYFTLISNRTASSGTMASVTLAYQLQTGLAIYTEGTGWGAGPFVPYAVVSLTDPFATVNGSSTITVTQTAHGLTTDQYVYFNSISDTDISGIPNTVLKKAFQVTVTGPDTYTISTVVGQAPGPVITYTANATSSTQGGTVAVFYPSSVVVNSNRTWDSGYTTGIGLQLRLWSQTNFGERLLFSPRQGPLYVWDPGAGATPNFTQRGQLIFGPDVPSKIGQIMVSDITRITIAFGANDIGPYDTTEYDPLLVRWSDAEDYTSWSESVLSLAGSTRLSHGSEIVGAIQTRQEIFVLTDAAAYAMQLVPDAVFNFTLLADNISIVSPNAIATAAGVVYWMGVDKFYIYSGRVETLPCAVRQYVFNDINRDQEAQFFAGTNEGYSEVWWFYCSVSGPNGTGTIENPNSVIDRYVIFNYLDRVWYYGKMDRTAWLDSPLRQFPQAATGKNVVVLHEAAVDDNSSPEPAPIPAYIQSSDFDISDGHNYGFVWRVIPDITFDGSNTTGLTNVNPYVKFKIRPRQNPGSGYYAGVISPEVNSKDSYAGTQTYNVQRFTEIIYSRIRGRQIAFRIESDALGTQWQLGVPNIDVRPDGRR
jgi:hypothetical protein